jgi:hypothetical protein
LSSFARLNASSFAFPFACAAFPIARELSPRARGVVRRAGRSARVRRRSRRTDVADGTVYNNDRTTF